MVKIGAYFASGQCGKYIPVRLKTHTDITKGLKKVCENNDVKYGSISGIGNVRQLTYQLLIPDSQARHGVKLTEPKVHPGPLELLSLKGVVFQSEAGETLLHLHGIFSDQEGKLFGGHLAEDGNPVLGTLDAFITELRDAKIIRQMDEDVGLGLSTPIGSFIEVPS